MLLLVIQSVFCLHIVKIPFANGGNTPASKYAPHVLYEALKQKTAIQETFEIDMNRVYRQSFGDAFMTIWSILSAGNFVLNIGGDHSVAISTVYASNEVCRSHGEVLGVLWCDAHTDIATPETSQSGNINEMPLSVLLGYTLPLLTFGEALDASQIGYFGVQDLNEAEMDIIDHLHINVLENEDEVKEWMKKFDRVHISFDANVLENTCIPTQVLKNIFQYAKKTKKLVSLDIVEYCPEFDRENAALNAIVDLVKMIE